jgi:hypothetical protein
VRRKTFETFFMIRLGPGSSISAAGASLAFGVLGAANPFVFALTFAFAFESRSREKPGGRPRSSSREKKRSFSSSLSSLSGSWDVSESPSSSVAVSPEARRWRCGGRGGSGSSEWSG